MEEVADVDAMIVDKYRFLDEYDSLVRFFRHERDKNAPYGLVLVDRFAKYVDDLSDVDVIRLLVYFYKKKPTCAENDVLRMGAKRAIQTRFYKYLYGYDMPPSVQEMDQIYLINLGMSNGSGILTTCKEYVIDDVLRGVMPKVEVELLPEKPKIKKRNRKNKLSLKVKNMSLEEIMAWAKELGVTQAEINRYQNCHAGFAKMGVVNHIAKALRKANQFEWFGFDIENKQ